MVKIKEGYIFNNYRLEKIIRSGGYSVVYRASDLNSVPRYSYSIAIKVLPLARIIDEKLIREFKEEVKKVKSIMHENVVKVYDFFENNGSYFMVMELMDTDLERLIADRKNIDYPEVFSIMRKAASGLSFIHKLGIIHKDFVPPNILLSAALKKVKITDFGLSKKPSMFDRIFNRDIFSGKVRGRESYIAPEEYTGKFDKRVDIFSFGRVLDDILSALKLKKSSNIEYLIKTATQKEPEKRFSNMEEIIYFLDKDDTLNYD